MPARSGDAHHLLLEATSLSRMPEPPHDPLPQAQGLLSSEQVAAQQAITSTGRIVGSSSETASSFVGEDTGSSEDVPPTGSSNVSNGFPGSSGERIATMRLDHIPNGPGNASRTQSYLPTQPSERSPIEEITMSAMLPEDDGMNALRKKLHHIREMALSSEEKAKRMHALMTADFAAFKEVNEAPYLETRPKSDLVHPFADSDLLPGKGECSTDSRSKSIILSTGDNPYKLRPGDVNRTYWPSLPGKNDTALSIHEDDVVVPPKRILGCEHYMRNVKIQCFDCERWYTCRHCHDACETHDLNRKMIRHMLCMHCARPQPAASHCQQCGLEAAAYYCDICRLWDNDTSRNIYHCDDCGICRRGQGLGRDYVHCKVCSSLSEHNFPVLTINIEVQRMYFNQLGFNTSVCGARHRMRLPYLRRLHVFFFSCCSGDEMWPLHSSGVLRCLHANFVQVPNL